MSLWIVAWGVSATLANLDPAWIALIGTLLGGIGLKVAERWLGSKQVKVSDATQIRSELRESLINARAENRELDGEVDVWKEKYYEARDEILRLKAHIIANGLQIPEEPKA